MPVKVIGMIGVAPPQGTALHVIAGGISPTFLREFSQAHEAAGFDYVLVGYYASSAEGFSVASYAACQTKTLSFLIAHRPGVVAPTRAPPRRSTSFPAAAWRCTSSWATAMRISSAKATFPPRKSATHGPPSIST
jgi:hypothetical protein